MKKNKLNIIITILFTFLLYSCQSAKNAIEGKKRSDQSDEFLVEKKNPLAMPPDYEKLPTPGGQEVAPETFSNNKELKDLLNIEDTDTIDSENEGNPTDLESSIIEKIQ
tara:strand:+ start:78 stop:404 length:327 start_codon:yes stop_codon:yes gene_type:complete